MKNEKYYTRDKIFSSQTTNKISHKITSTLLGYFHWILFKETLRNGKNHQIEAIKFTLNTKQSSIQLHRARQFQHGHGVTPKEFQLKRSSTTTTANTRWSARACSPSWRHSLASESHSHSSSSSSTSSIASTGGLSSWFLFN